MYKIKHAYILFQVIATILADNKTLQAFENNTIAIQELEAQKNKLLEQITNAINDSVAFLQKSNDSEARLGVQYMTYLGDHFQGIEDDVGHEVSPNDTRRAHKIQLSMQDIAKVLKKEQAAAYKLSDINGKTVHNKIEEWLLEQERKKIKDLADRKRRGKFEKCPRFGTANKKSKKASRRQLQMHSPPPDGATATTNSSTKKKSNKIKYPCCRKCCKSSYMGCL